MPLILAPIVGLVLVDPPVTISVVSGLAACEYGQPLTGVMVVVASTTTNEPATVLALHRGCLHAQYLSRRGAGSCP
jgi:hypothetical protein